jgi:hypothetical protein
MVVEGKVLPSIVTVTFLAPAALTPSDITPEALPDGLLIVGLLLELAPVEPLEPLEPVEPEEPELPVDELTGLTTTFAVALPLPPLFEQLKLYVNTLGLLPETVRMPVDALPEPALPPLHDPVAVQLLGLLVLLHVRVLLLPEVMLEGEAVRVTEGGGVLLVPRTDAPTLPADPGPIDP